MMDRMSPGAMMGQQMEQMGPGMMGADTGPMGPGTMGRGMMHGLRIVPMMHLSIEDVRHFLEHHIAAHGLERLKVGPVEQTDADTITADIVTLDDSLALRLLVDPHTGLVNEVH